MCWFSPCGNSSNIKIKNEEEEGKKKKDDPKILKKINYFIIILFEIVKFVIIVLPSVLKGRG